MSASIGAKTVNRSPLPIRPKIDRVNRWSTAIGNPVILGRWQTICSSNFCFYVFFFLPFRISSSSSAFFFVMFCRYFLRFVKNIDALLI